MIGGPVHTFYARVRRDALIGPIFNARIEDWPARLEKLCTFWSSVMLMSGRYKGTPMIVHAELPGISSAHFERWLALFRTTAQDVCPDGAALLFIDRSERIAESVQLGIALCRGDGPIRIPPGAREPVS